MPSNFDIGGDITKSIDAVVGFFEKKKRKANIEKLVSAARERGDKVTLNVDPETGTVTPKIETQAESPFAGLLEGRGDFGAAELQSVSSTGSARFGFPADKARNQAARKRTEFIKTAETLLTQPESFKELQGGSVTLSRGEVQQTFDLSKTEGMERALQFKFGSDFREQEDTAHLGTLLDEKIAEREQKKTDVKQAKTEKKVPEFGKGKIDFPCGKSSFKKAVAEYDAETVENIVNVIRKAQKDNVPIAKIKADLEAKGFKSELFFKNVK